MTLLKCVCPEKKEESISFLFQMVLFCMKNKHSKKTNIIKHNNL